MLCQIVPRVKTNLFYNLDKGQYFSVRLSVCVFKIKLHSSKPFLQKYNISLCLRWQNNAKKTKFTRNTFTNFEMTLFKMWCVEFHKN